MPSRVITARELPSGSSSRLPAAITLAHQDLVAIELDPQRLQRTAVVLQRQGGYQSAAARAFIEVAREVAGRLAS